MPNPAVPTTLKILRGNPSKRPINKLEPQPEVKEPHCPAHLDATAKEEWKRLVSILLNMRVLTESNYIALAGLCQSYSLWVKASEKLNSGGILYETPGGHVQPSPCISIANQQLAIMTRLVTEFGLTPVSKTKVAMIPDVKTGNAWDDL